MRDHIRREAQAYEPSAAWFIIPMSVAAAVLMVIGATGRDADAETSAAQPPAAVAPAAAAAAQPASAVAPAAQSAPQSVGHVQAF